MFELIYPCDFADHSSLSLLSPLSSFALNILCPMTNILRPLIKSNIALLHQKVALLDLLVSRAGAKQASIGEESTAVCV